MRPFSIVTLLIGLSLALGAGSCKKEDDNSPSTSIGDNDYIEFMLNDTLRQIVGGKALSTSAMVLSKTPSPYLYLNYADGTKGFLNTQFTQYSATPIVAKRYTYSTLNATDFPTFSYTIIPTPSSGYKTDLNHSRGYFEVTRLDSLGGKIEGTFAYDSLFFESATHVKQPGWYRVTDGKFRMTRK